MSVSNDYITLTRRWVEAFVIRFNLCPFARPVFMADRIRYCVSKATALDALVMDFLNELHYLSQSSPELVETTLLIHPHILQDFNTYNDFLHLTTLLLQEYDYEGIVQVASFHPEYQFEGTLPTDAENYTNRSPYPMLHLLREDSIEDATHQHPDPETIPIRNIKLMQNLGTVHIQEMLHLLYKKNR